MKTILKKITIIYLIVLGFFLFLGFCMKNIGIGFYVFGILFLISLPFISIYLYESYQKIKESKSVEKYQNCLRLLIDKHYSTLTNKYSMLTYQDDYGNWIYERFLHELEYFVKNVVYKNIPVENDTIKKTKWDVWNIFIQTMEKRGFKEENLSYPINAALDPYEFEKHCASILRNVGFTAKATKGSGDQGVDVVAEKNGIKVAIQCKLYSQAVNNTAVQEVNTGKSYYKADYAVVVSNNTYTISARQLAKSCGVLLLHINDLANLEKLLNFPKENSNSSYI